MESGKQRGGKRRDVPRRSRAAQRTIRRQQIIDATIHSVATLGFADTTLATVAKNTDISQAALVFHFKTKDALLTAALEYLVNQHRAAWRSAIEGLADDPLARICAMIRVDFSPEICTRKRVAVWHAFYGEAKTRPTYSRLCDEQDKEHTAFLESACREMTSAGRSSVDDPAIMAAMIDGLIDGMWSWLLFDETFDRKGACNTVRTLLTVLFPSDRSVIDRLLADEF